MEYKPFDLEAAKRGEKLWVMGKNLDCGPYGVLQIAQFPNGDIVAELSNESLLSFDRNGDSLNHRLIMAPKPKRKVKRWVNVYCDDLTGQHKEKFYFGALYKSQFDAERERQLGALDTISVEFEVKD